MPRIQLPIANGFYQSASMQLSNQECVNFYPNIVQSPALSQETLLGTPGLSQITTTGFANQVNRGGHTFRGINYKVNGTGLYRVDRIMSPGGIVTYSTTLLGQIEGTKRVSIADNGVQMLILNPGGKGYILDDNDVLAEITDPDFIANGNPQTVVFINSYFVCTTDSKKFINSAPNDGTDWNALDFTAAEADPDDIVTAINFRNVLYVAGSQTIEAFQNIAATSAPFQRQEGFVIPKGCYAPFSMIQVNNTFMFVGGGVNESPAIWALNGNSVDKVSTTAIDTFLNRLTDMEIRDIFAMSYAQDGAYFVVFKIEGKTAFVFNTVTGRWHEQKSTFVNNKGVTVTTAWRVNSIETAYGLTICGDSEDGRIGSLEIDNYKEYERNIIRSFSTQPFSDQGNVMTVSQLELTVESGVGDFETENPQVRMSYSDDGKKFSDEVSRSIGAVGQYSNRCIWYKQGRIPRFRVFKFTMSDPVFPAILKLEANMRGHQIGS